MAISRTIKDVEATLKEITSRLRARKNGPSPDMLTGLSKVLNSYRKLVEIKQGGPPKAHRMSEEEKLEEGDWQHIEALRQG